MTSYEFENLAENFGYPGTLVNRLNERDRENDQCSHAGYRAYFFYRDVLKKNQKVIHTTKMRVYKGAIRTVATCASEEMCTIDNGEN